MLRSQLAGRRSHNRRPVLCLCVSVLGHALLLGGWFGFGANGEALLQDSGAGGASSMEVSLVGGETGEEKPPVPVPDPAAELLARLGDNSQRPPSRAQAENSPTPSPLALSDLLAEASSRSTATGTVDGQRDGTAEQTRTGMKNVSGLTPGAAAGGRQAAGGGLWALIEPCWRRQRVPAGAHAQMIVELDLWGRLAAPPQIIRTSAMKLDRDQLLSEARAVDALTACLPMAKGRFSGAHTLNFRRG